MNQLAQTAFEYAKAAHESINQTRKYSGEPYIMHPMRVVSILIANGEKDNEVLAAAYLHDVLEDVWPVNKVYRPEMIEELFGTRVLNLVKELTDQYVSSAYPTINRTNRKRMEVERIAKISLPALKVKLADLIDNTQDIMTHDKGFGFVYLREKEKIIESLRPRIGEIGTDRTALNLYMLAKGQIAQWLTPPITLRT